MHKLLLALSLTPALALAQRTYEIDPAHSSAQFSVRHLMVSNVRGEFTKLTGSVLYDPANLAASRVDAVIDATTINTREPKRDEHLRSPDFLDTARFPKIEFHSKQVTGSGGKLQVRGDLTLHGVTREVVLDVELSPEVQDPWGNARIGAQATTRISRKDWGLTWNRLLETGGAVVGDEVAITIDIEAVRKPEAKKGS